jgi:hypothetical protein
MAFFVLSTAAISPAMASVNFTGKIDWVEVWATGNIAFTMIPAISGTCNGQFIVNASMPGAKALIATVLSSKAQGKQIRVASTVD